MKTIIFLVFMSFTIFVKSQDTDQYIPEVEGDVEFYLDDGMNTGAKNFAYLSGTSVVGGYFDLHFQRKLGQVMSIDAGYSIKMFSGFDLIENIEKDLIRKALRKDKGGSSGSGFSFSIQYYNTRRAITAKTYVSLNYRTRVESYETFKYIRQDTYFSYGLKTLSKNNLGFDVGYGLGLRTRKVNYTTSAGSGLENLTEFAPFFNMDIRIGYFF